MTSTVEKCAESRLELTKEVERWQAARPHLAGDSQSLKAISARINREFSRISRLIEATEEHERRGRRILAMWTQIRILEAQHRLKSLIRRVEAMVR